MSASVTVPTIGLARLGRTLVETGLLAQQHRCGRRLEDEREGAVLEDGDLDRDDGADLRLGGRVVLLDEIHDAHAVRPERGTDRRRRGGFACGDLDLDDRSDLLLCHDWFPSYSLFERSAAVTAWRLG